MSAIVKGEGRESRPTPTRAVRQGTRGRLWAAIAVGGALGALARGGLEEALPFDGRSWPWATFVANTVGTALLAYFVTRLQERLPPSTFRRPLLGTGLCGALTTFSTFQLELIELADHGEVGLAAAYLAASVAAGLALAVVGTMLTRRARLR